MSRAEFGIARTAIRQIVVLVVVGVIVVDKPTAILAGCVVIFKATVAKYDVVITLRVVTPNAFGTTVAHSCVIIEAVIAKNSAVKIVVFVLCKQRATDGTMDFFVHNKTPFRFILNFFKRIIYKRKLQTFAADINRRGMTNIDIN